MFLLLRQYEASQWYILEVHANKVRLATSKLCPTLVIRVILYYTTSFESVLLLLESENQI